MKNQYLEKKLNSNLSCILKCLRITPMKYKKIILGISMIIPIIFQLIFQELDSSFMGELSKLVDTVTEHYNRYQFAQGLQITEEFFWNTFTDNYLELVKKRVFNSQDNDKASAVSCLRLGLSVILRLLSPVMPTITDEIWSWCFSEEYNTVSIHESNWPTEEEFSKYKKSKFQNILIKTLKIF